MLQTTLTPIEHKPASGINPRIILLALGMFALGTDAFVVAGVLPVIARETGVTEGLAGQLVTAFSLTYGLGATFLAAFTGRWPRNRVLIGALGLFCLTNLASALSPTFPLLMLTRVLAGCFAATYSPLAYSVGTALAPPEKRGQALALVVMGLTVATVIGSPLGTWVGEHYGWRMSFGLVAVLAAIAFLALLLVGLPRTEAAPVASLRERLTPITQPRLILALLPCFLWYLGVYMVYTYIAQLLQLNLSIADVSGLLVVYGLGVVIGSWSGGNLADRLGPNRPLLFAALLLIIVESLLALATRSLLIGLPALLIWGVLSAALFTPQQHRLLSLAPEHTNVMLALNNSMYYLGIAGGAAVGGLALRAFAVTQLGWIGAASIALAVIIFSLSIRLQGRSEGTVAQTHAHANMEEVPILPE